VLQATLKEPGDRDIVIAAGTEVRDARALAGYDAAAAGYARELSAEPAQKPFDCWLLDRIAGDARGGPVADVGIGPGHVAARLAASGASVVGVDLSPAVIDEARSLFPDLEFEVGDAFVHMATSELPAVIAGLTRVLIPGGRLAFVLHAGEEVRQVGEFFGAPVDLEFVLHNASEVVDAVAAAGLVDIEWYLRSPLRDVETPTERLYVVARRPL
jgi:SAM-dependent methyltransferase